MDEAARALAEFAARARRRSPTCTSELREQARRDQLPRLRGHRERGARSSRCSTRVEQPSTGEPVEVDRRPRRRSTASRAARSATPARSRATRCEIEVVDTQKTPGGLIVHLGRGQARRAARGRDGHVHRRRRAARHDPRQPLGDAPPALGAEGGARRARGAEGLAGRARSAALRLLALPADDRRGEAARRGSGQRRGPAQRRLGDRGDAVRRGQEVGRGGAVRREVRRHGARDAHRRQVGRAVRRHARPARGRHRPVQDHDGDRDRAGRAAHRGGDRRGRARLRAALEGELGHAAGAVRSRRSRRRRASTSCSTSSSSSGARSRS